MDNLPATVQAANLTPAERQRMNAEAFMPVFDIALATERRNMLVSFTKSLMIEGTDYGSIPGVDKPTLLKPGAEKLVTLFGLTPVFIFEVATEEWTGQKYGEPLFYYRIKCQLARDGRLIGEGIGSANSWEVKHRYRWVKESQLTDAQRANKANLPMRDSSLTEFQFALEKAETTGPYGKPGAYWKRFDDAIAAGEAVLHTKKTRANKDLPCYTIPDVSYRVPNTDFADIVNTLQKMAQKRALVAAVLISVNASEFYTQDVEDMDIIDVPFTVLKPGDTGKGPEPKAEDKQPGPGATAESVGASDVSGGEPRTTGPAKTYDTSTPKKPPARKSAASKTEAAAAGAEPSKQEADALAALDEAGTIDALTHTFNGLPADVRRPGTAVFEKFKKRREGMMPPKAAGADEQDDIPF